MAIRFERKAVLAKIEAAYGTDPVPTGAANAVLLKAAEINVLQGERIPRDLLRTGYGNLAGWLVGRHVSLTCRVDLAGSGVAGTPPPYGPLLRACGLAETIDAGVSVTYTPVNAGFESNHIYSNHEGTRTILAGVRGNARLLFQRNRPPEIAFSLLGLWTSDTSVVFPALTTTAWKDPLPSTKANTPTFSIGAQSVVGSSLELDLGMDVAYIERINRQDIMVRDRRPKLTALIEELPLATKDFFAMAGAAPVALSYVHGVGAGKICTIAVGEMQVKDAPRQEEETDTMLNVSAEILAGAPDFSIAFT